MKEQEIRALIQSEIQQYASGSRFGLAPVQRHTHNGIDSPPINLGNQTPGMKVEGSVKFTGQHTYKIGVNFNPTAVYVHGNVVGANSGELFMTVGNAQIGPSFYLQPGTTSQVIVGGPQQNIIQSCTYFGTDHLGATHSVVDEGHIVDVYYGGTVYARATLGFAAASGNAVSSQFISNSNTTQWLYFNVNTLVAGWTINLSFTII